STGASSARGDGTDRDGRRLTRGTDERGEPLLHGPNKAVFYRDLISGCTCGTHVATSGAADHGHLEHRALVKADEVGALGDRVQVVVAAIQQVAGAVG